MVLLSVTDVLFVGMERRRNLASVIKASYGKRGQSEGMIEVAGRWGLGRAVTLV